MQTKIRRCGAPGMAAAEFLIVAIPLLLAGLGSVEAARWQLARLAVRHALYEAARAGATQGADVGAIGSAFERALAPLAGPRAAPGMPTWRVDRLSPRAAHYLDFADSAAGGRRLSHDYQAERRAQDIAAGRPQGRGAHSGEDIHAANTLRLKVTYLHPPLLPGMSALWRHWPAHGESDPLVRAGRASLGWLAISTTVAVPMQSAAVAGPDSILGPIPAPDSALPPPPPVPGGAGGCAGWWCQAGDPAQGAPPWRPVQPSQPSPPGQPGQPAPPATRPGPAPSPGEAPGAPPDPEGCGVVLCCAPAAG